jgi:hypothetical protein
MTKVLVFLLALAIVIVCTGAVLVRNQGFLPWPAAPILIKVVKTTTTIGKGDYPGSGDGPTPSSSSSFEELAGFDVTNATKSGCFEDTVAPMDSGENMRVLKCSEPQADVPYFGSGTPSTAATIWLLYWLSPYQQGKLDAGARPLAHSAYASYGACWLAQKRLEKEGRDIFAENVDRAIRAHTIPPVDNSAPSYCKALKNTPAPHAP